MTATTAELLRRELETIVDRYEAVIRDTLPAARGLDRKTIIDSLLDFLDKVAGRLESPARIGQVDTLAELSRLHARQRAGLPNFTLEQVVGDYRLLRRELLHALRAHGPIPEQDEQVLHDSLDQGITFSAQEYLGIARGREAQMARALEESREQQRVQLAELQSVIEHVPEALYVGSMTGMVHANRQALLQLGFDSPEDLKKDVPTLARLVENRDPDTGLPIPLEELPFAQALRGQSAVRETEVKHQKTGERRIIRSSAAPILVEGRVVGAVAVNVDVTDARRRERDVRQQLLDERRAREAGQSQVVALEQEGLLRQRFIEALSHDLRTPLSAVRVSAELLARSPALPEKEARLPRRILDSVARIDRMIRDLLDASAIRAGKPLRLPRERVDLRALARDTLEELATIHGDRFRLEAPAPTPGEWSAEALRRVLENLCGNAVKYGDPSAPITVTVAHAKGAARLAVHNQGRPLTEVELTTLFEPFERTRAARASGQGGWGIGLTLVRGLVSALGGSVRVESSAAAGTTFEVLLPTASS